MKSISSVFGIETVSINNSKENLTSHKLSPKILSKVYRVYTENTTPITKTEKNFTFEVDNEDKS